MMDDEKLRKEMVETQLIPRGVRDPATLESMRTVPRHLFISALYEPLAYDDAPLNIGFKQAISQPYVVGLMTQAAKADKYSKVLEVGTGSGYQAAVLSLIAKEVYTIEMIPELAEEASERFEQLGFSNIHLKIGNGLSGWPKHAPYDAILVTAAVPEVPQELVDQLAAGGRLVLPVGKGFNQELCVYEKTKSGKLSKTHLEIVHFGPLNGS